MQRLQIQVTQTAAGDMDFDDLYDEISRDWQYKAKALQARRWHKLKHEVQGTTY